MPDITKTNQYFKSKNIQINKSSESYIQWFPSLTHSNKELECLQRSICKLLLLICVYEIHVWAKVPRHLQGDQKTSL